MKNIDLTEYIKDNLKISNLKSLDDFQKIVDNIKEGYAKEIAKPPFKRFSPDHLDEEFKKVFYEGLQEHLDSDLEDFGMYSTVTYLNEFDDKSECTLFHCNNSDKPIGELVTYETIC